MSPRLTSTPRTVPLGVNLVATNTGEPREAGGDPRLLRPLGRLPAPVADYLAISTLCPTPTKRAKPVYLKIPTVAEQAKLEHVLPRHSASVASR